MSLDEVDIEVLLLDRLAAARKAASRRRGGESLDDALSGAMGADQ